MNINIFCRCRLFPSWSGEGFITTPVLYIYTTSKVKDQLYQLLQPKELTIQNLQWACLITSRYNEICFDFQRTFIREEIASIQGQFIRRSVVVYLLALSITRII